MTSQLQVAGIPVHIEGNGPETIVMLHGWPDTHRIWSAQVAHFSHQYRCVRFTLPGFDGSRHRGYTLAEITDTLRQIVDAVSPDQKVILMLHDWGCMFGYQFAMLYPERVSRIVAIDIGDANSEEFRNTLSLPAKGMVFAYQFTLALAWYAGDSVGTRVSRTVARALQGKADPQHIHGGMNYPYAMRWMRTLGGLDDLKPLAPNCPFFYAYARKKPFQFHSPSWLTAMAQKPGNVVREFDCGHWVMVDRAKTFNASVGDWLAATSGRQRE